jgi:hypothetical protein
VLTVDGYATVERSQGDVEGVRVCMTCASQASPLLSMLPYGMTAAVAVAIGRFARPGHSEADPSASTGEDDA